ncbi:uncharacterized protein LOC144157643 isoform X1 [Haemaphysalis longicornis]
MVYVFEQVCVIFPWLYFCVPEPPLPPPVNQTVDGFKAFGKLPEVVAAYTSSNCATYLCLNASRTLYDRQKKHVQYMWYFEGLNGTRKKATSFDIHFGDSLDKPWYYIDGDTCHNYTGEVSYSDYSTCMFGICPLPPDTLCALWVKRWAATNIPKDCLDAFHRICGKGYPDFSTELCYGV